MIAVTRNTGKDRFVEHYEQLRSRALGGAGTGTHVGMVLLRREGIAAWMARSVPDNEAVVRRVADSARCAIVGKEIDIRMVRALASMALTLGNLGGTSS